jgi:hypothetical protein
LIVRRGALRRFDALKRKTAKLPVVVTWDRSEEERRNEKRAGGQGAGDRAKEAGGTGKGAVSDRRRADRRQTPPFTWELADFVLVGEAPLESGRPATKTARKRRKKA